MKEDYEILLASLMPDQSEPDYHLTNAEIRGYVRNNLDQVAGESAESHLAVCTECRDATEVLRTAEIRHPVVPEKVGGFGAFLTSQARPLGYAGLVLLIIGGVLLALFLTRKYGDKPTPRGISVNVNAATSPPTVDLHVEQDPKPLSSFPDSQVSPNSNISSGSVSNSNDREKQSPPANGPAPISPSLQRAIASAIQTEKLEQPQVLVELAGASSNLLSDTADSQPFLLLRPVGQVLNERNPTFRWQALKGATGYQVTIADSQLDEIANSGQITNTEWKASLSLRPGVIYSWQVTAFKDGKRITSPVMPAPPARFKILDRKQSEQLRRMKQAMPDYHLALGVLYTQAGLLDEAMLEFQELLKDKRQAALAEKLLGSIRAMKK